MVLFIVALVLSITALPVFAQTATPPPPIQREFFSIGGRSDHLALFRQGEEAITKLIEDALKESFKVYQPLFGSKSGSTTQIPFQVVVWLTDNPDRGQTVDVEGNIVNALAEAGLWPRADMIADAPVADQVGAILDNEVCYIRAYKTFPAVTYKEAIIAHEMSHCYQMYYNRAAFMVTKAKKTDQGNDWWIEGGAGWLASLVYPAQFPNRTITRFGYNNDALAVAYTDFYLWTYIASAEVLGSAQATVDYMMAAPVDVNTHAQYLESVKAGENSTEVFHKWMLALVQGRIPFQPNINLPGFTLKSAVSGSVDLHTLRYSGDRAKIIDIKVDAGNQATVTAINLTAHNYAVSLMIGGVPIRLSDSVSAKFCPPPGGLELLISRGNGAKDDKTDFTLTFGQTPSATPCEPAKAVDTESCIVGDWVVVGLPKAITDAGIVMDTRHYVFNFKADGSLSGHYDVEVDNPYSQMSIAVPFTGSYELTPLGDGDRFKVKTWTWVYASSGTVTTITDGKTEDISSEAISMLNETAAAGAPTEITCKGDHITWVAGGDQVFKLDRILVP